MGFGDGEDVIGYSIENMGVFCVECFEKEFGESHEILEDEIIDLNGTTCNCFCICPI
jgi:hypothetical protein